jgi:hypothetical protein
VKCLIRYLDYDGFQVEEWAEDLYAVCIQHEMDHLEGTLFIDYLSRLKRQRAIDKVKKAKQARSSAKTFPDLADAGAVHENLVPLVAGDCACLDHSALPGPVCACCASASLELCE